MERLLQSLSPLSICHWFFPRRDDARDGPSETAETTDALIYDQRTGRYRLRQDLFEKVIADAAEVMWSDKKVKDL